MAGGGGAVRVTGGGGECSGSPLHKGDDHRRRTHAQGFRMEVGQDEQRQQQDLSPDARPSHQHTRSSRSSGGSGSHKRNRHDSGTSRRNVTSASEEPPRSVPLIDSGDLIFLSGDATWSYKSWREGTMPVTAQPGYYPPEYMSPTGEWSTNLCDCCEDCGICLCGLCFPACFGCYVANKYGENCLLPCVPGGMTAMRTHMRLTYGIRGTVCNDSLLMCFCGWCETCRMAREVKRLQS